MQRRDLENIAAIVDGAIYGNEDIENNLSFTINTAFEKPRQPLLIPFNFVGYELKPQQAFLDTGASVTYVADVLLKELNLPIMEVEPRTQIVANNARITVTHAVVIPIRIQAMNSKL